VPRAEFKADKITSVGSADNMLIVVNTNKPKPLLFITVGYNFCVFGETEKRVIAGLWRKVLVSAKLR
jgi:hypothetical protein